MKRRGHHSRLTAPPGFYSNDNGRIVCAHHLGMGDFVTERMTMPEVAETLAYFVAERLIRKGESLCEDCRRGVA